MGNGSSALPPLLFASDVLVPSFDVEKIVQILFETFEFSDVGVCSKAPLSLMSTGCRTGLVVDLGCTSTAIVTPIVDGYAFWESRVVEPDPSRDLPESFLASTLREKIPAAFRKSSAAHYIIETLIREHMCIVSEGTTGSTSSTVLPFTLPDGSVLTFDAQKDCCATPTEYYFSKESKSSANLESLVRRGGLRAYPEDRQSVVQNIYFNLMP